MKTIMQVKRRDLQKIYLVYIRMDTTGLCLVVVWMDHSVRIESGKLIRHQPADGFIVLFINECK